MSISNKMKRARVHTEFRCEVCSERASSTHHIKPKRDNGSNNMFNLISLCEKHHEIADRLRNNNFAKFEVISVPSTREELINFLKLIDVCNVTQRVVSKEGRRPFHCATNLPNWPNQKKLEAFIRRGYSNA